MVEGDRLDRAAAELDRRFGLEVLYLFGSQAAGRARPESDVDLGALFRRSPPPEALFEAASDLAEILGRRIDLVDLDRASPILVRQVIANGRLLVESDPQRRIGLFVRNVSQYEDLKILRREAEGRLLARFAQDGP